MDRTNDRESGTIGAVRIIWDGSAGKSILRAVFACASISMKRIRALEKEQLCHVWTKFWKDAGIPCFRRSMPETDQRLSNGREHASAAGEVLIIWMH